MLNVFLALYLRIFQIYVTSRCSALIGKHPIIHSKKMYSTECSPVLCCHHVTTNTWVPPPTQQSSTLAPESACPTPSSAARVGPRVQLLGGSATGGAWLGAGAASSPPAPGLPTEKTLAPPVHKLQWRLRRKNAVDNVRTSRPMMELPLVKPASLTPLTPPARMLVDLLAGSAVDLF